jgi:phosphatidylglycerophosphate synthase
VSDARFQRWSSLHGGAAPTGLVGAWLRLIYFLARPLARRRVSPDAITTFGLTIALLSLIPAAGPGRLPLVAAALIVLAGILDGLDGAVAVRTDRVTPWGSVLDPLCDRLADICSVAALWLVGAPAGWCVAGGALALLHEQVRASARVNGMPEIGVVTVSERPTRVIVSAAFLVAAGLYPGAASTWATVGAVAWTVLGLIGLGQLIRTVKARLGRPGSAPSSPAGRRFLP